MSRKKSRLVFGVGVNDASYVIGGRNIETGKQWVCPFYRKWQSMLGRCYNEKYQEKKPTYIGCYVCNDWLTFSVFKDWMERQEWEGRELDKDLLFEGNKEYSPDKCVFVDSTLNLFVNDHGRSRGEHMIGVYFDKHAKKLRSQCSNPLTKRLEHLGCFTSEMGAHLAWKKRKLELVDELMNAGYIEDIRIYDNLRNKYS